MTTNKIKTSVNINPDVWHKFKIKCATLGVNMNDKLEEVIKEYISKK